MLFLLLLSCGRCEDRAPKAVALGSLSGPATITRAGGAPFEATTGPVYAGDEIATRPGAQATVLTADGQTLILAEATNFRLGGAPGAVRAELLEGALTAKGIKLTILSAYGEATFGTGAGATVAVRQGGLLVRVLDGEIAVVDPKGQRTVATAGQELKVSLLGAEIVAPPAPATPAPQRELEAPVLFSLLASKGVTLVRKAGSSKFLPAPSGGLVLEPETAFKVTAGAQAALTTEGLELKLEPLATGVVRTGKRTGEKTSAGLRLDSGGAQVNASGASEQTLSLELGGQTIAVTSREESSFKAARTKAGAALEVQAGAISVTTGGREETLSAGQTLAVGKGGVSLGRRSRPALVLTTARRAQVFTQGPMDLALGWPALEGGAAKVQVAADAAFTRVLLSGRPTGSFVVVKSPPAGGELHWRVLSKEGTLRYEGHARFGLDRSAQRKSESLDSEVADSGLAASVHFQSAVPRLIFTFPPTPDAKKYRVRVFAAANLGRAVFDQQVPGTRCPVEPGTIPEGSYVWYAAPLDAAGNELAGGRMNKLEIVYDNSMTSLEITEPAPGAAPTGPTMKVSGVAPAGAALSVNGTAVPTDGKGRFSAQVPSAGHAVFELLGAGGAAYWVRALRGAP